jgi:SAM-dependent methyltransferase
MSTNETWKGRLYDRYVSSGQAARFASGGPELAFRDRAHYVASIIKRYIPRDTSLTILDIGCGHGTFVYFLGRAGYNDVSGIDSSAEQVEVAQQLGIERVYHRRLNEYLSQARECSADVVLLIDILEHLTRGELLVALDEVFRILRPGGKCIVHVPNGGGIFGMGTFYGDLTHEHAFTRRSSEQIFRTVGFKSVACFEDRPIVHGFKTFVRLLFWIVGTLPFRLLSAAEDGNSRALLSRNIFICCTK